MAANALTARRKSLADELAGIVGEIEDRMGRDDFNPEAAEYVALRENRDKVQGHLADVLATEQARSLAASKPAPTGDAGEPISRMRSILREYDRGNSERFDIEYEIARAYGVIKTGDPLLTPQPTRIQVAQLPVITPALDSVSAVPTGQSYDFVVPPPPVAAGTVAEGEKKQRVEFASVRVEGSLETDAHILDVSRQTLEDDSAAEGLLRSWLSAGVRLRQNAKVAAAIAGASGTLTATNAELIAAIRSGKAALSIFGVTANAVHVHPNDAALIDLEAWAIGHTDSPMSQTSVFGMSVVENPGIAEGTAYVGAMRDAVYLPYRGAINTYITDSGMTVEDTPRDRFSHNILGILGEGRSKVHVVQPKLIVKCTVTAP